MTNCQGPAAIFQKDAVLHELTLRWGEHLDVLLNTSDTPGDEGSHFAALLSADLATPPK